MGVAYQKSRGCNWVACALVLAAVAAAVILAVVVIRHKRSSYSMDSMPMPPGANFNGNYTHAMQLALTFLDIQKCKYILFCIYLLFHLAKNYEIMQLCNRIPCFGQNVVLKLDCAFW
jgi:hypothetical protein